MYEIVEIEVEGIIYKINIYIFNHFLSWFPAPKPNSLLANDIGNYSSLMPSTSISTVSGILAKSLQFGSCLLLMFYYFKWFIFVKWSLITWMISFSCLVFYLFIL